MRRIIWVFLMALLLSGCSGSQNQETMETSRYRFTLVSPIADYPYWDTVREGMETASQTYGVDTQYVGPEEINGEAQLKYIEMAIAAQVDGIITMALDEETFTPVINKAAEQGIPVVLVDTDAPDSHRSYYVGTSNYAAGQVAGKAIGKMLDGHGTIGIITGANNAENLNERIRGFQQAISQFAALNIVSIAPTNSDLLKAKEKTKSMLEDYPNLDAIFGISSTDILGAAQVVVEKDMVGDILLLGFDDLEETLQYIEDGVIYGTVAQSPYNMGYQSVELLTKILDGEVFDKKVYDTGVVLITNKNTVP